MDENDDYWAYIDLLGRQIYPDLLRLYGFNKKADLLASTEPLTGFETAWAYRNVMNREITDRGVMERDLGGYNRPEEDLLHELSHFVVVFREYLNAEHDDNGMLIRLIGSVRDYVAERTVLLTHEYRALRDQTLALHNKMTGICERLSDDRIDGATAAHIRSKWADEYQRLELPQVTLAQVMQARERDLNDSRGYFHIGKPTDNGDATYFESGYHIPRVHISYFVAPQPGDNEIELVEMAIRMKRVVYRSLVISSDSVCDSFKDDDDDGNFYYFRFRLIGDDVEFAHIQKLKFSDGHDAEFSVRSIPREIWIATEHIHTPGLQDDDWFIRYRGMEMHVEPTHGYELGDSDDIERGVNNGTMIEPSSEPSRPYGPTDVVLMAEAFVPYLLAGLGMEELAFSYIRANHHRVTVLEDAEVADRSLRYFTRSTAREFYKFDRKPNPTVEDLAQMIHRIGARAIKIGSAINADGEPRWRQRPLDRPLAEVVGAFEDSILKFGGNEIISGLENYELVNRELDFRQMARIDRRLGRTPDPSFY